ncbi:MAG: MFS transporter [Candidatus Heimdallarchaeota archaeon]|nr:MFS transporter [Candidatus Heimdallarchaeota archaeon]MBY8995400.1 MFS transporter [Candidatus Heimdallarchaeota archaeon]
MAILKPGQKAAYGICRFGTSIFMNVTTLAAIWIYDNVFGLAGYPYLNSAAAAVGKIIIAFSSFIFGYISDIIPGNKINRRKFFIWTGAPMLAISFVMIFIPHLFISSTSIWSVFSWYLIWNSMFNLFYGYLLTPYQSWMTEITTEDDRVGMSGIQNFTNLFSNLLGFAFVFMIPTFLHLEEGQALTGDASTTLIISIVVFAIIEMVVFLPALLMIKEKKVERKQRNILREFKVVLTNRNYIIWFMAQGVYSMGLTLITALVLDFATDILMFTNFIQTVVFGLLVFGTIMLCFLAWVPIAKRIGKKWSIIISFLFLGAVLPFSLIFRVIPVGTLTFEYIGYLYAFLLGVGLSGPYLFPYAIIADIADKDERDTKESRAGMYNGFNSIPLNIFQAIALLLVGFLNNELFTFRLYLLGPIAGIFIVASIFILLLGNFDPFMKKNGFDTANTKSIESTEDPIDSVGG